MHVLMLIQKFNYSQTKTHFKREVHYDHHQKTKISLMECNKHDYIKTMSL